MIIERRREGETTNLDILPKPLRYFFAEDLSLLEPARALLEHDTLTFTHSIEVAGICREIARLLKLESEREKFLVQASVVHDVGKLEPPPFNSSKKRRIKSRRAKKY